MGNGLRLRVTRNEGHKPKTRKENHIMKNRKNILTYIVAAVATLVTSASSSLGAPPLQPPQNYTGRLTHGEFVSCEGQILNPPAYAVGGTWVLNIEQDDATTGPAAGSPHNGRLPRRQQLHGVPAHRVDAGLARRRHLHLHVGTQVTATLDTNTTPATFSWHVEFDDNCTLRTYGSLTYFGLANN